MLCDTCGPTKPKYKEVRKELSPVCSVCTPRHGAWWICHCSECEAFKAENPCHPWIWDYLMEQMNNIFIFTNSYLNDLEYDVLNNLQRTHDEGMRRMHETGRS